MQAYSNPDRENEPTSLPDLEVFEWTAEEAAEYQLGHDDDALMALERDFPTMHMSSQARDAALAQYIEDAGIRGGWFYWYCFPGCMPDSEAFGPYETAEEARQAAQDDAAY